MSCLSDPAFRFEQVCDAPDYSSYFKKTPKHRSQSTTPRTPISPIKFESYEQITPFMLMPIPLKQKENYVVGSTWNLEITSMTMAAKFNHDEYEYDKNFAKFFSAKANQATITMLLH